MAQSGKQLMEDLIKATASKGSWGTHLCKSCSKCSKCTCGKHKCSIKSPALELSPPCSSYNYQFKARRATSVQNTKKYTPHATYEPRQLISKSQYNSEFVQKLQNTQTPKLSKGEGNIKTGGPTFNKTTYDQSFTRIVCGRVQPIKNPQNLKCIPELKISSSSNYRDTYKWHLKSQIKKEKPIKHTDNLKTEPSAFIGKSRYALDFKQFSGYKRQNIFKPDRSFIPQKALHTETSYNQHYCPKPIERCPAEIETKNV